MSTKIHGMHIKDSKFDTLCLHVTVDVHREELYNRLEPYDNMKLEASIRVTPQVIKERKEGAINEALNYLYQEVKMKLTPKILEMDFGEKEKK